MLFLFMHNFIYLFILCLFFFFLKKKTNSSNFCYVIGCKENKSTEFVFLQHLKIFVILVFKVILFILYSYFINLFEIRF